MARMQLEVERQTKKKSPIADIVGFMSYNHLISTVTGYSEKCAGFACRGVKTQTLI